LLGQKILQPARKALGPMKISSGFRSEELNKLVEKAETVTIGLDMQQMSFPIMSAPEN